MFRFYAELNDFLPSSRRLVTFSHSFQLRASVKDMIEALGVPHTEVDLILVNGEPMDFSYLVREDDRISVYPFFESLDITSLVRVRPQPLPEPRFVLDTHLGRLAAYLRMLGFDTLFRNDYADEELALISSREHRILLTRDAGLLKRKVVTHGYWVRETNARRQVIRILQRFDLFSAIVPFQRCLRCNGLLQPVRKEDVLDRLPPRTKQLLCGIPPLPCLWRHLLERFSLQAHAGARRAGDPHLDPRELKVYSDLADRRSQGFEGESHRARVPHG